MKSEMNHLIQIISWILIFPSNPFCQIQDVLIREVNEIQQSASLNSDDYNDLLKLNLVNKARIIGLGEATHGTHEFLSYKSKIVKYLAKNAHSRLLLFEMEFGDAVFLNECINNPECDIRQCMMHMLTWVWRTKEVESLFEWIRQYNLRPNHKNKIMVLGVDSQWPEKNLQLIELYSNKLSAKDSTELRQITHEYRKLLYGPPGTETKKDFTNIILDLEQFLKNHNNQYRKGLSKTEDAFLYHALKMIQQSIINSDFSKNIRDSTMTENILYLHKLFNSKRSFFWGHNIHVANYHSYRPESFTKNTVGYFLRNKLKSKYIAIGFGFSNGTFSAYSMDLQKPIEGFSIHEVMDPSSFNYICHNSNLSNFIIPMHEINPGSPLRIKLSNSMDFLHITSTFKEEFRENLFIGKINILDYDYLVYFKNTTHSELIELEPLLK